MEYLLLPVEKVSREAGREVNVPGVSPVSSPSAKRQEGTPQVDRF